MDCLTADYTRKGFPGGSDNKESACNVGDLHTIIWIYHSLFICAKLLQLCPTLCDPMDCSLPGSSVHGIWVGVKLSVWRCQKWQSTPVFLPGESHRQRSLAGYKSIGSHRVGHNWVTKHSTKIGRVRMPDENTKGGEKEYWDPERDLQKVEDT